MMPISKSLSAAASRWLLLLGLCLPLVSHALCARNEPGTLWNYQGLIANQYRVRMTLVFSGETLKGVYFYGSQLRDIALRGELRNGRDLRLEELDATGKVTGYFTAEFPERDPGTTYGDSPLTCDVIAGHWQGVDGKPPLTVYLTTESSTAGSLQHRYGAIGVRDDEIVNRGAARFGRGVKAGDKASVAAQIRYPVTLGLDGKRVTLKSPAALLARYDDIFTPALCEQIQQGLPRNMFVRDQGAMLGSGVVWFGADGKVIALNN